MLMLKLFIYFSSLALADTKDFEIQLGRQSCLQEDGVQFCEGTKYETSNESIDLDGSIPWHKNFDEFSVIVMIKKRPTQYIVRVNLYLAKDNSSLASYATEVSNLSELNAIKLGSGEVKKSEKENFRFWFRLK